MEILPLLKAVLKQYKIILACSVFTAGLVILLTMNMPKEFESSAIIYTGIGSGVSPETIIQNRSENVRFAFDNLLNIVKSRETLKEVGLRLFSLHLSLKKADPAIISPEHFETVKNNIPPDVRKLAADTPEETYKNVLAEADTNPYLIGIISYPSLYYSQKRLSSVIVKRITNSDMISLSYTTNDPGVAQKTLEILIDVCIRNYRNINENQTNTVVIYFEEQLKQAEERLYKAEEKELQFKTTYNLVNFDIQTGIVISQREAILSEINRENESIAALEAAMKNIEKQLGSQMQTLNNIDFLSKRQQLSRLLTQLAAAELDNRSPERIANLQLQIDQVKSELNRDISESSIQPSDGISKEKVINEYFLRVVSYEESKAKVKALEARKDAALGQYSSFVPLGDTLKRIQREIEISEKAYISALNNLNQSKFRQQDQQSFSKIQVIDRPVYPLVSKPSNRKIMVLLGGMVGFMIPAMFFLFSAYFNKSIKTPQRAEELTGLKVGGVFPNIHRLNAQKNAEIVSDGLSDMILKNLYLTENKYQQQRILIISTRPSEGKTTIGSLLCERLIQKGRKCLIVVPYLDSGSWSVVSYKIDDSFYKVKAEDLVPTDRLNNADFLILELPSLIMNDYPVTLIREFDMAFLICDANREWAKADQNALDSFIKISGKTPQLILNDVDVDIIEEVLGKIVG